ncbi:helix-turn-helix transcriptional regulator [Corynebacterium antarcticum]|uniref:helix-turn-helix transcriptional regulator n=1 Tax=Corynebacterium antarcticum TaxID=2800405 RepID=UPI0022608C18|nr:helix-turn-helix domain-containing protein [Corynebacterium antarcticum]MCX7540616.1 helix-turn-helix domain-containing protein [Corynebacterium antarcticum]
MDHLTTAQASELLGIPVATLRYWRSIGQGPRSFKMGRLTFYRRDELEAWVEAQYNATVSGAA